MKMTFINKNILRRFDCFHSNAYKNIQVIRKNMHDVSVIVNRIITSKMNINCDYGISNRILEYIDYMSKY